MAEEEDESAPTHKKASQALRALGINEESPLWCFESLEWEPPMEDARVRSRDRDADRYIQLGVSPGFGFGFGFGFRLRSWISQFLTAT